MALFDVFKRKKETERFKKKREVKSVAEKEEKETAEAQSKEEKVLRFGASEIAPEVIMRPHITEKSTNLSSQNNVYAFRVSGKANKAMIKRAVEELYKVTVEKVAVISMPPKKRFVLGKFGTKPGYKKALVYLKEGDKIEFV